MFKLACREQSIARTIDRTWQNVIIMSLIAEITWLKWKQLTVITTPLYSCKFHVIDVKRSRRKQRACPINRPAPIHPWREWVHVNWLAVSDE